MMFQPTFSRILASRYVVHERLVNEPSRFVFKAWDNVLEQTVAIKGHRDFTPVRDEFRLLRRLAHPRLPTPLYIGATTDVDDPSRVFWYFTQTWIDGSSLAARSGRFDPADPLPLRRVARALLEWVEYLHRAGLHRLDLKPDHLIESADGWYLVDLDQARATAPLSDLELHGTLPYAAPETLSGESIDMRSDLYSVGAVLYHAVTGQPRPVRGKTLEAIRAHLLEAPRPPLPETWHQAAPDLCRLIHDLMAPHAKDRPASAQDALARLHADGSRAHLPSHRPVLQAELVGRDEPLEAVTRIVDAFARGGCVVVSGPRGAGRSRFLRELTLRWQAQSIPSLMIDGKTADGHGESPIALMGRFLATLETSGQKPRAPREPDTETGARKLLELATRARVNDRPGPRILVDDADRLDATSQAILARLLPYLDTTPLVLVLAATNFPIRGSEHQKPAGAPGATTADNRQFLEALSGVPKVTLSPLSESAVQAWVEDSLGADVLAEHFPMDRVQTLSGGLPARVHALLEAWARNPDTELGADIFAGQRPGMAEQIASFDDRVRPLLFSLACLEIPFGQDLVAAVAAQAVPENAVTKPLPWQAALGELVSAGILARLGKGATYQFVDPATRQGVLAAYDGDSRALYARVATALETLASTAEQTGLAEETGRLFVLAGQPDRARSFFNQAARAAQQQGRWLDAARALDRLLETFPEPTPVAIPAARRRLEVLFEAGKHATVLEEAEQWLKAGVATNPVDQAHLHGILGEALAALGKHASAEQALQRAMELNQTATRPDTQARWLIRLAWSRLESGHQDEARETLEKLDQIPAVLPEALEVQRLHLEATWRIRTGKTSPELAGKLESAITRAESAGLRGQAMSLRNALVQIQRQVGDADETEQAFQDLVRACHENLDALREAAAHHNFGLWLRQRGDIKQAATHLERATRLYERVGHRERALRNQLELADILLEARRLPHAAAVLKEVAQGMEEGVPVDETTRLGWELLDLRQKRLSGAYEGLEDRLADLARRVSDEHPQSLYWEVQADRMALALATDQPHQAVALLATMAEDLPETSDEPVVKRLHTLAATAHEKLAGDAPGAGSGQEAPETALSMPVRPPEEAMANPPPPAVDQATLRAVPRHDSNFWLRHFRELLEAAHAEADLAAALAKLAGDLLGGRGLALLFDGNTPQVIRGHADLEADLDEISTTMLERVRTTRQPLVCPDVLADPALNQVRSLRAGHIRSVVCYPILKDNACTGVIYVDHSQPNLAGGDHVVQTLGMVADMTADLLAALEAARRPPTEPETRFGLLGNSAPMRQLRQTLANLARSTSPDLIVLFEGETGTGKSMTARALHAQGSRSEKPFVTANCAAISDGLFESRMFGHVKGAFTGAISNQDGFFQLASGGTLFLDEVADLPLSQQAALLEPLGGARRYRKIGASKDSAVDFHLFCATTKDLNEAVKAGTFRPELLRRLNVNVCRIPPLRERGPEDIDLLAGHLIARSLAQVGSRPSHRDGDSESWVKPRDYLTRDALERLHNHPWPYNVGEMENLFRNEQIRQVMASGERVDRDLIDRILDLAPAERLIPLRRSGGPPTGLRYKELDAWLTQTKEAYIRAVYDRHDGNVSATAKALGCGRNTIYKYLRK